MQLDSGVLMAARRELVWCIATVIAGAAAPGSDLIHNYVVGIGGRRESTVLGYGVSYLRT